VHAAFSMDGFETPSRSVHGLLSIYRARWRASTTMSFWAKWFRAQIHGWLTSMHHGAVTARSLHLNLNVWQR